ncbi:MAG: GNAT family N-acetyltransferase [Clostridia bacterium]|nr:GNAT family N-acetyltransferase [Clostridia bacterium]
MINYTIESVTQDMLPMCLKTIHRAFIGNCEKYGFTKENYPSCAAFMTLAELIEEKNSGTHIYTISVDGEMVGCVQIKRTDGDIYHFRRFAVLPEYRHLGLGKELVDYCKSKAKAYGGKRLRLLMVYENESLRTLYESYGFTLIETGRDDAHPFLYGIYEMQL